MSTGVNQAAWFLIASGAAGGATLTASANAVLDLFRHRRDARQQLRAERRKAYAECLTVADEMAAYGVMRRQFAQRMSEPNAGEHFHDLKRDGESLNAELRALVSRMSFAVSALELLAPPDLAREAIKLQLVAALPVEDSRRLDTMTAFVNAARLDLGVGGDWRQWFPDGAYVNAARESVTPVPRPAEARGDA